jgi:hypothetical protein
MRLNDMYKVFTSHRTKRSSIGAHDRRFLSSKAGIALVVGLASFAGAAQAANWYVRPNSSSYGAGNGKTWTDAISGFSSIPWSSVACGDTVWLAGGNYTQALNVSKNCTSTSPVNIKRVVSSDAAQSATAGWSSSFDSTVNISNVSPGIVVPSGGSIYIDGRVSNGIKVNIASGGGDGAKAATSGNVDNLRISHLEVAGPGCAAARSCSTAAYGLNFAPSNYTVSNLYVGYVAVHAISEAFRASNWRTAVIEHSNLYDIANDGVDHEDTMYSYPSTNVTLRYNFIHDVPNDGLFFEYGGAVNFRLYGNVFYNSSYSLLTTKAPGNYGPIYIYNNVFAAPSASNYGFLASNGVVTATDTEVANNVFINVSHDFPNAHNNAYSYTSLNGYSWPSKETGSFTFAGDGGLANIAGGDAHLSATSALRNRGSALTADGSLNVDMDGNTRGADGSWDIGAFEFPAAAANTIVPPTNVSVQ